MERKKKPKDDRGIKKIATEKKERREIEKKKRKIYRKKVS